MALKGVSRRFFFLNLLTMSLIAVMTSYVHLDLGIHNEMYATIASGAVMGAGLFSVPMEEAVWTWLR